VAQPRELLELVEQHGGAALGHDLERPWLAGLTVEHLQDPAERPSADDLGDPESAPHRAVCRLVHRLNVNLIGIRVNEIGSAVPAVSARLDARPCYRRSVPDDERKGRRLGDETKGRIADLASGWDSKAPPVPEPPLKREASGPARVASDAPRRKLKTQPPPPPGSAARKALEDKIVELREAYGEDDAPRPPAAPGPRQAPRPPKTPTGQAPVGKRPARAELDLSSLPEADRTKENRGAVGIKHDRTASLTTNTASGTIGETPAPIFDRAAIAAGPRGALASERLSDRARPSADAGRDAAPAGSRLGSPPGDAIPPRLPERSPSGKAAPAGTGPTAARGSGSISDPAPASPSARAPRATTDDSLAEALAGLTAPSDPEEPGDPADGDPPRLAVPVGEFDHGQIVMEQDKLRTAHAQATIKRDAASALLGIAAPAPPRMPAAEVLFDEPTGKRGDEFDEPTRKRGEEDEPREATRGGGNRPASPGDRGRESPLWDDDKTREATRGGGARPASPGDRGRESPLWDDDKTREAVTTGFESSGTSTGRFDRGDPTVGDPRPDATALHAPASAAAPTGTLRSAASLPRRRGIAGDLLYIATVLAGLRRARRELTALSARQATRQQSRRHHLITLGRAAVTADGFDHPALGAAREQLAGIEEERSQHAGHVVAADAELGRVRRDREAKAKQYGDDIAGLDGELVALAKKLEPLDKEVTAAKKRGVDLHEALRRIDAKIAATEASLSSPKAAKLDRAEVQAEIAMLRADRKAIQSDEPVIAGQLDALSPRVAALEAARGEAQHKRAELETAEHDDQRRVEELLAAIGAKRKVVDRAAADAEALRDKILFKLGERLYVDRPADLTPEFAPVDAIDLELGSADRRVMELREILASVDRWKLARGIALLVVLLGAIGALVTWLVILRNWPMG
jgi:hypothetical protein